MAEPSTAESTSTPARLEPWRRTRERLVAALPVLAVVLGATLVLLGAALLARAGEHSTLSRIAGIAAPPLPARIDRALGLDRSATPDAMPEAPTAWDDRSVPAPPDLEGGLAMPRRPFRAEPAGALVARPVDALELPRLRVRVPVRLIARDAVPQGPYAGWLFGTGFPALPGNMVLAGHLDGENGVFGELGQLRPGDELRLGAGERVFVYVVTSLETVPSDAVHVLDPTPDATLTLMTCAGEWDESTRSYDSRLIVRATFLATGVPGASADIDSGG